MTRDEMIFELSERFTNELEELSTSQLSKLLSASEGSVLLSSDFLSEDVDVIMEEDDYEDEDDEIKDLTLIDELWEDDKDE